MSSELLATYAGLGTYDGENYYKGDECLGKRAELVTCDGVLEESDILLLFSSRSLCQGPNSCFESRRRYLRDQTAPRESRNTAKGARWFELMPSKFKKRASL